VLFPVPRSGEFALHVRTDAIDAPAGYDLEIRCVLGCERETTRFPVLLVHGWTGFEAIGPLTYFYKVVVTLEQLGYPLSVAVLDPYNHTTVRSAQLAEQIDETLVEWRARKVDLLGHSQGGIDSRAAVSMHGRGDVVSAVLTIASPHRGTYLTDVALGLAPGPAEDLVGALLNFVGAVGSQQKSDAKASFYSLSEQYMQGEFNPQNPDDPRVKYISYTGRTCDSLAFLDPENNCQDLCDPLIAWAYRMLKETRGANDGLVTVESAKWGEYRGEMIADHIDEVGQIAGITDLKFDHLAFYRDRARDLAAEQH
jgi:triacylglycerol esterase/lipase EstA (alpha/beta hydrolase family)